MMIFCIQIDIQEKKTSRDVQISLYLNNIPIRVYSMKTSETLKKRMYFVALLLVNEMAGCF